MTFGRQTLKLSFSLTRNIGISSRWYWPDGNIAGLVISIILILVFGILLAVKLGLKVQFNADLQGLSGMKYFQRR